ncbi:MAG: carbon-nitrogen hydrolase family protein [Novosphingobium sp.]
MIDRNHSGIDRRAWLKGAALTAATAAAAPGLAQAAAPAVPAAAPFIPAARIKARAVNFRPVMGDRVACAAKIKETIETAGRDGVKLIVFPEMALQGFEKCADCAARGRACDKHLATGELATGPLIRELADTVRRNDMYAIVGFGERDPVRPFLYNAAAVMGPEGLIGTNRKMGVGHGIAQVHSQSMFTSGDKITVFPTRYGPIGVGICYDVWMNGDVARLMVLQGARIIAVPTATVGTTVAGDLEKMAFARARENNVFVINANLVGGGFEGTIEGEPRFYSHSYIAGPEWPSSMGKIIAKTDDPFATVTGEIDLAQYESFIGRSHLVERRRKGGYDAQFSQAIAAGYAALIGKHVV